MSKGELKIFIRENRDVISNPVKIALADLIDEARKEFPVFPPPSSPEIASIDAITFKCLATKWFLKWFGDAQQ